MYHCRIHSNVSIYSVVLLWKCHKLTVMQQALLRYYGNATNSLLCNMHCYVTMEMLQNHCYATGSYVTMETPNMAQYIQLFIFNVFIFYF
jgi:hypothetical protein